MRAAQPGKREPAGEAPLPRTDILKGYAFLAPLLLFLLAFILAPVVGTMIDALFQDVSYLPGRFVWLRNFQSLLVDPGFRQSLGFTLLFCLVTVPLEMVFGLCFALLLHHPSRIRGLLRICVLIPWAVPAAVSGRVFQLIYNYHYGLANFLCRVVGISEARINWLGTSFGAFCSVVVADVWKTTPFVAIILLAGLSAIPEEYYHQARIDRAGPLKRFIAITLPLLRPVLVVALLFRTIDSLRIFDTIFVITGGGPGGATSPLSLYAYRFFVSGDFGYGSAISVALFLIALAFALTVVRFGRFREGIQ